MNEPLPPDIGARIVKRRSEKGWDQKRLCAATGIKQSRMSKLEHNKAVPSFAEIQLIALYLECDTHYFDTLRGALLRPSASKPAGPESPEPISP